MSIADDKLGRRGAIAGLAGVGAAVSLGPVACGTHASPTVRKAESPNASPGPGPRTLGRTGAEVAIVSLGGEGVLRSDAPNDDAVAMIREALDVGVRYCDTAPAYADSQRHYGEAFRARPGARDRIFLASKTHLRDRDGSLALLDDSLRTLGTEHLDLWQLHDLRTPEDLDAIFAPGGAIEAIERAKRDGKVRFTGITGHADPDVLAEAMGLYDFDTVLCPINPSDRRRLPFLEIVVPEARHRGMGVVAMKVFSAGRLLEDEAATPEELIRYAAAFADTLILGCGSAAEARANLALTDRVTPMPADERAALEERIAPQAALYDVYKRD